MNPAVLIEAREEKTRAFRLNACQNSNLEVVLCSAGRPLCFFDTSLHCVCRSLENYLHADADLVSGFWMSFAVSRSHSYVSRIFWAMMLLIV